MVALEIVLALAALFAFAYKWATKTYRTFEERGVPFEKPVPLLGNAAAIAFNKVSMPKSITDFYERNKHHKVIGYFNFRDPIFLISSPEIMKKIMVKDFDHFPNHMPFFNTEDEPLLDGMLSIMKDQRWKDMRNTLTPVFTASKMRTMFTLMNECFQESLQYLHEKCDGPNGADLEMKQCFTRLSNDIIASTAFGLKLNSYTQESNEFYQIGQAITKFKGAVLLKILISNLAPRLMKLLNIQVFDKTKTVYFMRLVMDSIKYREEHKIVRPDMIQLLMEAKKESKQNWSDEELVAQCFIFFFAAFENNANVICTTCHELMENPDIQERLYEEILAIKEELNGETLSYDVINKMKYMDMVLSESLRKWSLATLTDRLCSKNYTVKDDDDKVVCELLAGDRIWFPIYSLHRDERYYDNPLIFDPERFSDENKDKIKPFTYLPFGAGPRNCIGNRYALMQAKAMLYYLLEQFKLERSVNTVEDLEADIRGFQLNPVHGFWMRLVPRK